MDLDAVWDLESIVGAASSSRDAAHAASSSIEDYSGAAHASETIDGGGDAGGGVDYSSISTAEART